MAKVLAVVRIALGLVFFWAFLDKLFGFGYATPIGQGWLAGIPPTSGFLSYATYGPFTELYRAMAGQAWVDWLFMVGLAGIGLALILGIGLRIAVSAGTLLLLLMYLAMWPPKNNPLLDEHIIYIGVLWLVLLGSAGETWGLGKWWKHQPLVKANPVLK